MKYDFSHEQMYEISAKIIHIKKFQLYLMKRAPNGNKTDVTAHFFMLIEGNMVSEHEMRQIGSERIDWVDPDGVTLMPKLIDLKRILSFITV